MVSACACPAVRNSVPRLQEYGLFEGDGLGADINGFVTSQCVSDAQIILAGGEPKVATLLADINGLTTRPMHQRVSGYS